MGTFLKHVFKRYKASAVQGDSKVALQICEDWRCCRSHANEATSRLGRKWLQTGHLSCQI
jgi:hypothetical protein